VARFDPPVIQLAQSGSCRAMGSSRRGTKFISAAGVRCSELGRLEMDTIVASSLTVKMLVFPDSLAC
jgi:hypothetical protein